MASIFCLDIYEKQINLNETTEKYYIIPVFPNKQPYVSSIEK